MTQTFDGDIELSAAFTAFRAKMRQATFSEDE
jgi:hypothetical protein